MYSTNMQLIQNTILTNTFVQIKCHDMSHTLFAIYNVGLNMLRTLRDVKHTNNIETLDSHYKLVFKQ